MFDVDNAEEGKTFGNVARDLASGFWHDDFGVFAMIGVVAYDDLAGEEIGGFDNYGGIIVYVTSVFKGGAEGDGR